jgi:RNA polymerase sigma-70 factor (ECF subfamily)
MRTMATETFATAAAAATGRLERVGEASADVAMARYSAGDDAAFALVYDGLARRLHRYLLRCTRNAARAADLLQETFLHMHRARERFMVGCRVTPWAFAIAHRLAIDSARSERRERVNRSAIGGQRPADTSHEAVADDLLDAQRLASRLQRRLDGLPESQREAFELVRLEGLSVTEAARALGTTAGAVKLRLHRACEALRATSGRATMPRQGGAE